MNGFVRYNEKIFSWEDQVRLCQSIIRAQERGAKLVVSNADHPSIHNLYMNRSEKVTLGRSSVLSGKNEYRRAITECLYVFDPEV
jgi:DNA adenine methylase